MKRTLIIVILIVALVLGAVTGIVLLNKKQEPTVPVVPEVQEVVPPKKEVPLKRKPILQEDTMRDENDMPKSDVNVPEIG